MVTWLPIARPIVPKTRFLCLIKAAKINNVDNIAAEFAAEGVMGHIAEWLAGANVLLCKLINSILNINVFD